MHTDAPTGDRDGSTRLLRRRLHNQRLVRSSLTSPAAVVGWLVAMQAQEYAGAKWAIAQRARGLNDNDVERGCAVGQVLRTHILRPTWHFVSRDDLRWLLALSAPRVHAGNARVYRICELDAAVLRRSRRIVERALSGGEFLTRQELATVLTRGGVPAASGLRLAYLMMHAELEAVVCSGPMRGKQFTYALFDQRVPSRAAIERDEALARLIERYFDSRGPATARDFAWWSGLTVGDANRGIDAIGSKLVREVQGDRVFFSSAAEPPTRPLPPATVHLLPTYDEFGIAYRDRDEIRDPVPARRQPGRAEFMPLLFIDGRQRGTWRRTADGGRALDVRVTRPLSRLEGKNLEAQLTRYRRFLGVAAG